MRRPLPLKSASKLNDPKDSGAIRIIFPCSLTGEMMLALTLYNQNFRNFQIQPTKGRSFIKVIYYLQ
jgi:hypothetical protein